MKKFESKTLRILLVEVGAILIVQLIALHCLAKTDLVAKVFAAGPHTPFLAMLAIILYFVVRMMAMVLLPGMIFSRIGILLFDKITNQTGR